MDAQAIDTGVGIQQSQQTIQNQLYSQAQARLNGENQITGSILWRCWRSCYCRLLK